MGGLKYKFIFKIPYMYMGTCTNISQKKFKGEVEGIFLKYKTACENNLKCKILHYVCIMYMYMYM